MLKWQLCRSFVASLQGRRQTFGDSFLSNFLLNY